LSGRLNGLTVSVTATVSEEYDVMVVWNVCVYSVARCLKMIDPAQWVLLSYEKLSALFSLSSF